MPWQFEPQQYYWWETKLCASWFLTPEATLEQPTGGISEAEHGGSRPAQLGLSHNGQPAPCTGLHVHALCCHALQFNIDPILCLTAHAFSYTAICHTLNICLALFDIRRFVCLQVRQLTRLITKNSSCSSRVKLHSPSHCVTLPLSPCVLFITVRQLVRLINQMPMYLGPGWNILPCSFQRPLKGVT